MERLNWKHAILPAIIVAAGLASCGDPAPAEGRVAFRVDRNDFFGQVEIGLGEGVATGFGTALGGCEEEAIEVPVGVWDYTAMSEDMFAWEGSVEVRANECQVVELTLENAAVTLLGGYVMSAETVPADVYVDGEYVGKLSQSWRPELDAEAMDPDCGFQRRRFVEAMEDGRVALVAAPYGVERTVKVKHGSSSIRVRGVGSPSICVYASGF